MSKYEIITAIVAVFAAVLSTFNFIIQLLERSSKITVRLSNGFLANAIGGVSSTKIFITASNPSKHVITLASVGLALPKNANLVIPSSIGCSNITLPYELEPGKDCQFWIDVRELAVQLKANGHSGRVKVRGFYRDQLDRTFKSKSWKFDVEEWLQSA